MDSDKNVGVDLEWGEGDTGEGERQKSWDSHVNSLNNNKNRKKKKESMPTYHEPVQ